jgi:hypothetical protein
MVGFGASDFARCNLKLNGTPIAGESMTVGDPTMPGAAVVASGNLSSFTLVGAANVPASGGHVTLVCEHDTTNGSFPYVDAAASMWAHQTDSLQNNIVR